MGQLTQYNRAYCVYDHCYSNLTPGVLKHGFFKEVEISSMKDVIHKWAALKFSATDIDLVECFLPMDEEINVSPNARHFPIGPFEHYQTALL